MSAIIRPARKDELPEVLRLLGLAGLPAEGVGEHFGNFLVAEELDGLVGTVGLEYYGKSGLLRSLAVDARRRGKGLGERLTRAALAEARERGLAALYLLTTSAERFFRRFGFEPITREQIDPRLGSSKELRGACPQTAVAMRLSLRES